MKWCQWFRIISSLPTINANFSHRFNLNAEDIEVGLRQIDTLKTAIRDICPVFLSSIKCKAGKYRRPDGLCNNVNHPTWGAINTPFTRYGRHPFYYFRIQSLWEWVWSLKSWIFFRLLPPHFADHISAPKISTLRRSLPSARVVSRTMHPDEGYHDHAGTTMTFAWGQFMDHDFTLMGTALGASLYVDNMWLCM